MRVFGGVLSAPRTFDLVLYFAAERLGRAGLARNGRKATFGRHAGDRSPRTP